MPGSRERRAKRPEGITSIPNVVIDSPAFASLSAPEVALLLQLARRHTPRRNGEIALDCRRAAKLCRCSRATVLKAFAALVERGFITLVKDENYIQGKAREFALTFEMVNGRQPTDLWMGWEPGAPVARLPPRRPRDRTKSST